VQCFNFHKDQSLSVPCDQIDFSRARTVARSDNAITQRTQVTRAIDFRTAAEWNMPPPPIQKRHGLCRSSRNAFGKDTQCAVGLLFID